MPGFHPGQKFVNYDKLGLHFDFHTSYTQYQPEDHIRPGETMCLETSRGCMFKCNFCNFALTGRKTTDPKYHKDLTVLTNEIRDNWEKHRINRYYILDDTFNETTGKMEMVYRAIKDSGVPDFKFFAYLRLDLIKKHPEQIALLKDMGLQVAYFGIESLNDATLKVIGKPMKSSAIKSFLLELKAAWGNDIVMHGSFIAGLPLDTPETLAEWMKYVADPKGPLNSVTVNHLGIDQALPNAFGIDLDKFGYEMIETPGSDAPTYRWKNAHWDREQCKKLARKYNYFMIMSRRKKPYAWETMGLVDLGYTFEHVRDTAKLDFDRIEIKEKLEQQRDEYIKELCRYEGIEQ